MKLKNIIEDESQRSKFQDMLKYNLKDEAKAVKEYGEMIELATSLGLQTAVERLKHIQSDEARHHQILKTIISKENIHGFNSTGKEG
jgi:rubrerythrin